MRTPGGSGWALNGFPTDGTDESGVEWITTSDTEGWDDMAGTRGGVVPREDGDGARVEPTYLDPVPVVLRVRIKGPDPEATVRALAQLKAAVPVRLPAPLVYISRGTARHRMVKQEGKPTFKRVSETIIDAAIQLVAPDPLLFGGDGTGPTFTAGPVGLPRVEGGKRISTAKPLRLTAATPLRIAAKVTSGQLALAVGGTERPPTIIRITGPLPDFTIKANLGESIQVQRYIDPVPAGQFLEIDLARRTVKINGQVSRRNRLVGRWIIPAPGMVFEFTSSTYNETAAMAITATSAWR